jgi:serine/threonine protein kinase/tetratricopeptide (TPR) repeat protein
MLRCAQAVTKHAFHARVRAASSETRSRRALLGSIPGVKIKTDLTRPGYRNSDNAQTRQDTAHHAELLSEPPPSRGPSIGAHVGRYRLLRELGAGGMGVVYEALDPDLDRRVAIKLLLPRFHKAQLVREARALARLSHANVVTVHDVGEVDGRTFIAMELVEGSTLRHWLTHRTRSYREILEVLIPAGRGLAAAHAAQLVHRDFKPENIMVGHDGRVRVLDFGIVSAVVANPDSFRPPGEPDPRTDSLAANGGSKELRDASSGFAGTPAYMAPEQISTHAVDERADQFSFCVVLWEAIYGERPFHGTTLSERVTGRASVKPTEPSTRGVPLWLHRILVRGLSGNLGARHASMVALLDAIEAGLAREDAAARLIGRRYEPIQPTVSASSDTLAKVLDRLTSKVVTIHRITRLSGSDGDLDQARVKLARAFRDLASLRHPNVVGVLDFGFENEVSPYFVLDLRDAGVSLRAALRDQPERPVFDDLVQILRALSYLHRHRMQIGALTLDDVFVIEHEVKVLPLHDVMNAERRTRPPPATRGESSASISADLHAFGLLALQVLALRYPSATARGSDATDLSAIEVEPKVESVFARLLHPEAAQRYEHADAVIDALSDALGRSLTAETFQTRESRLRAAPLMGREAEVKQLSLAVQDVCRGSGGAWLICGESGVGKSRLLDEVRTLSLVQGALVLRGQEQSEGGSPYRLFRDALRWLALLTDLDELEAGVLLPIVPDLASVLDRPAAPAPELDASSMHARTCDVVTGILRRQKQPIVLLLEDLHWSRSDSLELLKRIVPITADMPLLVVATARNDERPGLRDALTGMKPLDLQRLSQDAVENLLVAMTGEQARRPEVVSLLWRETEGNAFFLVEVMRALAEESGGMARIGAGALPDKVFAGGVRRVIARRLDRVPQDARHLLGMAAVMGRTIDLSLLATLAPEADLERWCTQCVEASVLERTTEGTRFAHDKLREGVLAELSQEDQRQLSRLVADAIERGPTDRADRYSLLAHHYGKAGDREKESLYAALSGEQAIGSFAVAEGKALLARALELSEETSATAARRARLHRLLGEACYYEGKFDQSLSHLRCTLSLLGIAMPVSRFDWLLLLVRQLFLQGLLYTGLIRPSRVDPAAVRDANEASWAAARAAFVYSYDMDMLRALTLSLISVNQVRRGAQENPFGLGVLGYACASVKLKAGGSYFRRARRCAASTPESRRSLADVLHLQASYLISVGRLDDADRVALESAEVAEQIGDQINASVGLNIATICDHTRGRLPRMLSRSLNNQAYCDGEHRLLRACSLGLALCELGQPDEALAALRPGTGDPPPQLRVTRATVLGVVALAQARKGALPAAWAAVQECLQMGVAGELVPASCSVILTGPMIATLACWARAIDSAPVEAVAYQRTARGLLRRLRAYGRACRPGAAMAQYFDGHVRALSGDRNGALRAWSRASASAAELGMRYYEGLARLELGRACAEGTPKRVEHLERAAALLSECGVSNYDWVAVAGTAGTRTSRRAAES